MARQALTPRPYQEEALNALLSWWDSGKRGALLVLATGTGKALLLAETIVEIEKRWPGTRMLVATHIRELVAQNHEHLIRQWPDAPVGIVCAGLRRREFGRQITFASIGSIYRKPERLGAIDVMMVDECDLIPREGDGQYRATISALRAMQPHMQLAGFTATPFRLDSGALHLGEDAMFDGIAYEYGIAEGIRDGYLAPLRSKATRTVIDATGVRKVAGEFNEAELEKIATAEDKVEGVADEIVRHSEGRKCILAFCVGVGHAFAMRDALRARGVSTETVTGETPSGERDRIIADLKAGNIRCVTNVAVMTTGVNVPRIDVVAMVRPTMSARLLLQCAGRATRLCDEKSDALFLDFGGNIERHGPLDLIRAKEKKKGDGVAPVKTCPMCEEIILAGARECPSCGHQFEFQMQEREFKASDLPVLSTEKRPAQWMPVSEVSFHIHHKGGDRTATPTMRVEYLCGWLSYAEYVCFEHEGFARTKAEKWWDVFGFGAVPSTVVDAKNAIVGEPVTEIAVEKDGKWDRVVGWRLADGTEVDRWLNVKKPVEEEPMPEFEDEILY